MSIEIKVPDLPESVADGVLLDWRVAAGDAVQRDDNLVDIETDKVVLEIPAPDSGTVKKLLRQSGDVVASGELLALMEQSDVVADSKKTKAAVAERVAVADAPLSPAVKKLLADNKLEAVQINGSGKDGRIIKQDVLDYLARPAKPADQAADKPIDKSAAMPALPPAAAAAANADPQGRVEQRVPMTRLRARIAERLVRSQQTAAILTTFNEVNMKPVMDLRGKYQDKFLQKHDIKLGFMSFFVKAVTEALKEFPIVNASIDGGDIIYHGYYDIGIAVGSPRGLVVPILRDTDAMSFADIERKIKDFGARAQHGRIDLQELSGGTFSITNGGIFGSMLSTPIINPPQSAILGMHAIQQRAAVENGAVVARPCMYLALSYDHRIIDGREAVRFLMSVKHSLEDPAIMLFDL